jgi:hypothetical protein
LFALTAYGCKFRAGFPAVSERFCARLSAGKPSHAVHAKRLKANEKPLHN